MVRPPGVKGWHLSDKIVSRALDQAAAVVELSGGTDDLTAAQVRTCNWLHDQGLILLATDKNPSRLSLVCEAEYRSELGRQMRDSDRFVLSMYATCVVQHAPN